MYRTLERYDEQGEIERNTSIQKQTRLLEKKGCVDINYERRWIGTAPFCAGHQADCGTIHPNGQWKYILKDDYGDGAYCWTGKKVLCSRARCTESDPEYSDDFKSWWVGTAPACDGNTCDCVTQFGAVPYRQDSCGDGKCCVTGTKQLCIRPTGVNDSYSEWETDAREQCRRDKKVRDDLISRGVDIVKTIADAAAKSAAIG